MLSLKQRVRFVKLAAEIAVRPKPLGVGLRNQCYVGLAIETAQRSGETCAEYFGWSMSEMKAAIKQNNQIAPTRRNAHMALKSLKVAATGSPSLAA
jgi:hypothetical protein